MSPSNGESTPYINRPEHSPDSPLSVHSMTVAYNDRPVLWDVEYEASASALIGVIGPNGAGKSTFIKACLGLLPRATGAVQFWGKNYHSIRGRVAYVPQRESVDWDFPVSALEVVCMGRYQKIGWFRPVSKFHRERSRECLRQVGLEEYANRQISQLSGGQQQRVFIARALAQEADLYFMDEPLAGVDALTEETIIKILKDLKLQGKTVIAVHHDLSSVSEYFDEVLMLNNRVVAAGPVESTFTEENIRKTYGGRLALLDEAGESAAKSRLFRLPFKSPTARDER